MNCSRKKKIGFLLTIAVILSNAANVRAMYDNHLMRFTSRDPVVGNLGEPPTLHTYLYCANDPVNRSDSAGLLYTPAGGPDYDYRGTGRIIETATEFAVEYGYTGMLLSFGPYGDPFDNRYPGRGLFDYADLGFTFRVHGCRGTARGGALEDWQFGNYLSGYMAYHVGGLALEYDRIFGHIYSIGRGDGMDEWASRYFISKGAMDANQKIQELLGDRINGRGNGFWDKIANYFDKHDLSLYKADEVRLRRDLQWHYVNYLWEEELQ